jgi:hypothetical protein
MNSYENSGKFLQRWKASTGSVVDIRYWLQIIIHSFIQSLQVTEYIYWVHTTCQHTKPNVRESKIKIWSLFSGVLHSVNHKQNTKSEDMQSVLREQCGWPVQWAWMESLSSLEGTLKGKQKLDQPRARASDESQGQSQSQDWSCYSHVF